MNIAAYLAKGERDFPPAGTPGVESDWLDFCKLAVTHGKLWVGDPYVANPEDGCIVTVQSSDYIVQAKGMEFAGRRRTSRLRVFSTDINDPVLDVKIGEAFTDTAMVAICDMGALDEAIADDNDRFQELVMDQEYGDCGVVEFQMTRSIRLPYISTGFGDCSFTAFALRSGSEVVGMEVEFLPPNFVSGNEE